MEHMSMAEYAPPVSGTHLLEECPIGILTVDQDGVITWLNAAMEALLPTTASEVAGEALESLSAYHFQQFAAGAELIQIPAAADQPERWLRHWQQIIADDGGAVQTVHYCTEVTEYIQAHKERDRLARELERKATNDPLTGLLNQRALMLGLEPQVSRSRRYQNPLSVVMMSIDHIDDFDDRYGGRTKEQVLIAMGQLLKDQMRWADLIGRMNTGDFLFILPETEADAAGRLVEKIGEAVAQLHLNSGAGSSVTIRPLFGIAQWAKGEDPSLLLKRARQALESAALEQVG